MRALLSALIFAAAVTPVVAQQKAPPPSKEGVVMQVLQTALSNIQKAQCGATTQCAPATEAEKKNPPLSLTETSWFISNGAVNGLAAYCGLDWKKRNFDPLTEHLRKTVKKSDRQIALIGLINSIVVAQVQKEWTDKGPCDEKTRKGVDAKLDFKP
ncbi:MAG: hypothetical protein KF794_04045 [Xanthobacteraceae bacterium]|nr:hypothetical protein [Xanthobacteraceae bacterium]QYK45874.1 MAG: hypothetical protein KF794_04045 [Xanthobacteraceae bacterium]